jgi:hypothetical protein
MYGTLYAKMYKRLDELTSVSVDPLAGPVGE